VTITIEFHRSGTTPGKGLPEGSVQWDGADWPWDYRTEFPTFSTGTKLDLYIIEEADGTSPTESYNNSTGKATGDTVIGPETTLTVNPGDKTEGTSITY
jgi:hypothetical protein